MKRARDPRAPSRGVRVVLALCTVLGSVACGRPGQVGAPPPGGQVDLTSPGRVSWPVIEPEAPEAPLTDADVERIAIKVPREGVPTVAANSPSKGPAGAPVTLQIFSDFECSFCVRAAPTLADVEERYRGRVRLVWRNYPLPSHERARPAARAALAAFAQGGNAKFWQMHDWLYSADADLSDAGLRRGAAKLGLDVVRVEAAVQSRQLDAALEADMAEGDRVGIEGTPAAFINDYYLMGARSEAEYAVVIERALRESARP
jgi:protein-disulfide isomerase